MAQTRMHGASTDPLKTESESLKRHTSNNAAFSSNKSIKSFTSNITSSLRRTLSQTHTRTKSKTEKGPPQLRIAPPVAIEAQEPVVPLAGCSVHVTEIDDTNKSQFSLANSHEITGSETEETDYSSESDSDGDEEKLKREEDAKDYCEGGYHPTYINETYGPEKQYTIVRKLGWGHFSTVWLAYDTINMRHVAIKIVRSSKNYKEAAIDEIKILQKVRNGPDDHPGKHHVVQLLDSFIHIGPNGEHVCMVFEVLGENMLSLLLRYKSFAKDKTAELARKTSSAKSVSSLASTGTLDSTSLKDALLLKESFGGLPLTLVKQITKELLLALDYMHRECGLIHTDLKPENVLVEIHDVEKLVKILEREKRDKVLQRRLNRESSSVHLDENARTPIRHINHTTVPSPLVRTAPSFQRSRSHTVRVPCSPVRCSKPLTSPVPSQCGIDSFFRSFSFSQSATSNSSLTSIAQQGSPVTSTIQNGGVVNPSFSMNMAKSDKLGVSPRATAIGPKTSPNHLAAQTIIPEEAEDNDDEEFVDARSVLTTDDGTDSVAPPVRKLSTLNLDGVSVAPDLHDRGGSPNRTSTQNSTASENGSVISMGEFEGVISVKIADLGNSCWTNLHYTNDIQTRQYRAPEVILGGKWGCSTDIWSAACLVFELLTGDFLFDPKAGDPYTKDDDHLAQIVELLNCWPSKDWLKKCKYVRKFFDRSLTQFRNIGKLKYWTLDRVLIEKYHMPPEMAVSVAEFLGGMLQIEPRNRCDAGGLSNHPFLVDCNVDEHIARDVGSKGEDIEGWCNEVES